ncbi:phage tail tube protein [Saccharopolyspora sp. K220]|uniref:phage tail tube protein n=1 Tax=Saccharopolyspora soli TaxID=2926618 RepID=UPI001F5A6A52|nr:phage tail tube protein [Saccharopolyspora soli]MCI2421509.1 phage tail tube protein [Saccharopolyspora soli]
MAIPSGLDAQLMTGEESTYGTAVTVDRGYEFRSEALSLEAQRIESSAIRPGKRVLRSNRWFQGQRSVGGEITMELGTVSFGRWFKHCFGTVTTAQPDATNAPTVYQHTFTPGPLPPGLTVQVGRPDTAGTVHPFTYTGCKIASWTLSSAIGEIVTFAPTILGRDETTATELATASYPANLSLLTFVEGSLTLGGSVYEMRSVSLQGTNGIADDRYVHGSRLRNEPLEIGSEGSQARVYSGTIEGEFTNLAAYNRFVNGDEAEMVLLFAGANIASTYDFEVRITANVRFDGTTPNVPDANIVMQTLPIKAIDNGTTSIRLEYQTTDATV